MRAQSGRLTGLLPLGAQYPAKRHRQQQPNDYAGELSGARQPGGKFFRYCVHKRSRKNSE